MANSSNSLSYTGRDVSEIRKELIDMIPSLTNKWTDFNESDIGITLIELIAGAQDMQNFYFDTQTFETYLDTAVQEKNIRSLLRSMNYRIPLVNSARGRIVLEFSDDSYKEVNIPKYTRVFSSNVGIGISYVTLDAVSEKGSFSYLNVPIIEGELKTITLTRKDFESNTNISGNLSRRFYLGYKNVADRSVVVSQSGIFWEECDDALLKYRGGYYYSVHKDSEGQVYILFSPNFMSLIPSDYSSTVTIRFLISNGSSGILEAGSLDRIDISLNGLTNVINDIDTYGGADEPDLNRLKLLARQHAVTMDRYITLADYEYAVNSEPYVFKSIVKDWKYPEYVKEPYIVRVWAVDFSGKSLGEENIKTLKDKLLKKGNLEVSVEVANVVTVNFDIDAEVTLRTRTEEEKEQVIESIKNYMYKVYSLGEMEFGKRISYSLMLSYLRASSPYIKDVYLKNPTSDVEPRATDFPVLGEINIRVVDAISAE